MEMAITTGITAVVVGTSAGVTLACAKLTKSSASISGSSNSGQAGMQRILQDIGDSDAVLTKVSAGNAFTPKGIAIQTTGGSASTGTAVGDADDCSGRNYGTSKGFSISSSSNSISLRIPSVDSAGRPLVSRYRLVSYCIAKLRRNSYLCRYSCDVLNGSPVTGSLAFELVARASSVRLDYSGKAATSGGVTPGVKSTVTNLTTGLFDGQVAVDPSTVVLSPNVTGAIFVNVDLVAKDQAGTQEFFSGAKVRNSVL